MKHLILLLLFVVFPVSAEIKTFEWRAPGEYTDNSVLHPEDLTAFNTYCNGELIGWVAGDARIFIIDLPPNDYECYITAVVTRESSPSDLLIFSVNGEIPPPDPDPVPDDKIPEAPEARVR